MTSIEEYAAEMPDTDLDVLITKYFTLREKIAELRLLADEMERHVARRLPDKGNYVCADGRVIKHRRAASRRGWDNDALKHAVYVKTVIDADTGEILDGTTVWEKLTEAFNLSGSNIRTTWMKQNDIDPDEYASAVEYSDKIQVLAEANDGD